MADPASWDLLDWDCSSLTGWTDEDKGNGVSEIDPAGQLRLDTNTSAANNDYARRMKDIGSFPLQFTVEIKVKCDAVGTVPNIDHFQANFRRASEYLSIYAASDGFYVYNTGDGLQEVGTDLVKSGASAEFQTWRICVTYTSTAGHGTCDVYLSDSTHSAELVAEDMGCSYTGSYTDGEVKVMQWGYTTNDMLSHVDYIKIATGLWTPGAGGGTETTSISTLLQKASTSFLGYDSVIQKSFSGDVVLNAILRIIGTSSVSADSLIMATLENNINIDSLLRSTGSSVVDLNTILYLIRTGNISVDAILKVIGSQTTSLGSIIKKVYSSSLSADSVVAIGNSVYVSASALLEAAMLENVNIDLLLRSVKTEYITLNGLLLAAKQNNLSIDSLIMAANNINVELNSIISKLYYSGADIDAILSSGVSAAMVYTDSLIAAMYSEHALLDAYLSYSTPTPVVYLDSIIALYQSGYISLNALIMASKSVQVSVDALIASGISNNVLIDLIVSSISSGVVSMDSLLRNELSNTTSIDALLGIFTKILFDVVLEEAGYVLPYHSIIEVGSRTRNINVPTRTRII